ncbi:MAG: hypothetical protein M3346_08725 [Actinomycetota bacterium]|nr:hypothetical protein [Actinomycetota bacterium]
MLRDSHLFEVEQLDDIIEQHFSGCIRARFSWREPGRADNGARGLDH